MVRTIAERIGPIRNTFYGEHWEVKNEPSPENVAYSNLPLPLHTVRPARDTQSDYVLFGFYFILRM
jgi:hypothetical protein